MRSIYVITPDCYQGQLEAISVRADHHFRCSLASRVWVCRRKYTRLAQVSGTDRHIAIDLICRDVYKPSDAMLPCALQKNMRPVYIRVGELIGVAEAEINMRLRGEMENGIDLVLPQHALDVCRRGNVSVLECKVWPAVEDARVVQCCAIVELIQRDDIVVVGVRQDQMADKPTGSALALAPIFSSPW
jgi:hypothetical protein